jgi:hypothetical protein
MSTKSPKKYYKVVRVGQYGNLYSYNSVPGQNYESFNCIEYKVGEWTKPKIEGTRLFVFNTLKEAQAQFNKNWACWDYYSIYECECKGHIECSGVKCSNFFPDFWKKMNALLNKKKKVKQELLGKTYDFYSCPATLVTKIKLTKKIR